MSKTLTVIVVLIIVVTIVAVIVLSGKFATSPDTNPLIGWGSATRIGDCTTYQYPIQDINGTLVPSNISTDPAVINNLTPIPTPTCVYGDQQSLALMSRTCTTINSGDDPINICVKNDGTLAQLGETEEFYDAGPCSNNTCPDSIVNLSVGFHPDTAEPSCIGYDGSDVTIGKCDAGYDKQFLYESITDSTVPSYLSPVSITFRDTGKCLGVDLGNPVSLVYDPTYLNQQSSCSQTLIAGYSLIQKTCSGTMWAVLPSFTYFGVKAPTQLVYINGLDFTGAPLNSVEDFVAWLILKNVQSLYWGGSSIVGATLVGTDKNCVGTGFSTQTIDWDAYLMYKTLPACTEPGASGCIPPLQ